ncbi:30S ribosomal protein S8 [Candidatus Peregrinibacteria bacterium]|nr:30S ribosomal protein S8 [Candidatus Peregrinibacteria bacterium]MBI4129498.1 30S ribosomal protein S8 [Candidatus Peregrinibacteria bacterium]
MTYVTDPIGDLLTRMRNAQAARRLGCHAQWSLLKQKLCELLVREGWLRDVRVSGEDPKRELEVTFVPGKILVLKRVSRPGRRWYVPAADLRPVLRGCGVAVLTTSQGVMTDKEARKKKVGGEVLCTVS